MEFEIPEEMLESGNVGCKIELGEDDVVHAHMGKRTFIWKGVSSFQNAWQEFMSGRGQISKGQEIAFVGDPFGREEKLREGWEGIGGILVLCRTDNGFKMRLDTLDEGREYDYVINREEGLDYLNSRIMSGALEEEKEEPTLSQPN